MLRGWDRATCSLRGGERATEWMEGGSQQVRRRARYGRSGDAELEVDDEEEDDRDDLGVSFDDATHRIL